MELKIIYCVSDIHGCLNEFKEALEFIDLSGNNKLILLGDYVHRGFDSYGVLEEIMRLQREYGNDKMIGLMGNHEERCRRGSVPMESSTYSDIFDENLEKKYINWMKNLPLYYIEGNNIFCHAGLDEKNEGNLTFKRDVDKYLFLWKFPPELGRFNDGMKIIAGHVYTSEIAHNPKYHDIYYDGESHFYIDGNVLEHHILNILKIDVENEKYFQIDYRGEYPVLPFEE